jgi:glycosyltransferase involved in cell wall biosynthesis
MSTTNRVAILTDFIGHDPAYSLCSVVHNQIKMLQYGGHYPRLITRGGVFHEYGAVEEWGLDPGEIGQNVVNVTPDSEREVDYLCDQMRLALEGIDVVITHDLIYQPNQWKYHVAARRIAKDSDMRWLHFVHSATNMGVAQKTGRFRGELEGKFPNSRLAVFHAEEMSRKGSAFGYEVDEIIIVPNAIDLTEDFDPVAREICEGMHTSDVIAVYPCRLDRGKQPHIVIEIFGELVAMGYEARVIIVDFHSTDGDKAVYREEMKALADRLAVDVQFASDYQEYHISHKAVMDLFEYGDILVHPSMSESDPLILPEAMWKRCGMVLNFDLPVFRQHDGSALFYKFSSRIDVNTGLPGDTTTSYTDRGAYMRQAAAGIAYIMENNPVLRSHARVRKNRSLEAVWKNHLWPAVEGLTIPG